MKSRSRYFATSLIVCLSIGIFAVAGYLHAAESDKEMQEGKTAIMEGAKKMMEATNMKTVSLKQYTAHFGNSSQSEGGMRCPVRYRTR